MKLTNNITAAILAGGKSSRMGTDKGILPVNGVPMVSHIIEKLVPLVNNIIILANNKNYDDFDLQVYNDLVKNSGPLGGIITAFKICSSQKILFLSCDAPFVSQNVVKKMIENCEGCQVVVPVHDDITEQFPVIYDRSCLEFMEQSVKSGMLILNKLNNSFVVNKVETNNIMEKNAFSNINTPKDLKLAEYEN